LSLISAASHRSPDEAQPPAAAIRYPEVVGVKDPISLLGDEQRQHQLGERGADLESGHAERSGGDAKAWVDTLVGLDEGVEDVHRAASARWF
jgi:hypothetical protein